MDDESNFVHVRNDISVLSAATLRTNPGTAYRMLKDFVDLQGMAIWGVKFPREGYKLREILGQILCFFNRLNGQVIFE